jgi:hypothetical protein
VKNIELNQQAESNTDSMSSSTPITFPHDSRSAQKTAKAGVITCNDLVCEDQYSIMTRATTTDAVEHTTSVYSLDEDTTSLVETSRSITSIGTDGVAQSSMSLLRTSGAVRTVDEVTMTAHDDSGSVTATFSKDGLRWDDETSSVYIGGDIFRIQFSSGDAESNNIPCLRIQARHPTLGGYVTRWSTDQNMD